MQIHRHDLYLIIGNYIAYVPMFMCIYILMCIYIFCLCVCLISLFRPVFGNWTVINAIYAWVIKIKKDILAIILMAIISPGTEKREKKSSIFLQFLNQMQTAIHFVQTIIKVAVRSGKLGYRHTTVALLVRHLILYHHKTSSNNALQSGKFATQALF